MWKNSVPLATSRPGFRPQMGAMQLTKKHISVKLRRSRVGRRGKELELQQNRNEIGPSYPHETAEKWKQLLLGWAGTLG